MEEYATYIMTDVESTEPIANGAADPAINEGEDAEEDVSCSTCQNVP